ncbi:Phage DNA packaging [Oenococcus oeni]|uniref:head-tail connector protein n=1 Tax=Oenococcus oeni TaxID=1247 RepID=UPI00107DD64C|nr:head-tail connector protein [Oenococcus oeni]AVI94103.1 DNA packaging protein [Oenococcus oeni]SYV99700.1 Phage DNA packaging [Oenococcus oeni]SYW03875.1 Phage DNA packaging [Oenococcus oeni]SYW17653.1 Phage DNA packaging [Oenococcus oeni]VDC14622.1 Phage DNA packaging [Oenococcus oeni]
MTVQLADLKNSVRVDVDTDDNLLQGYIKAAVAYLTNAIGADDANNTFYSRSDVSPLFDTATIALASAYYSNRDALTNVSAAPVPLVSDSIIYQLRAMWEDWQLSLSSDDSGEDDGN